MHSPRVTTQGGGALDGLDGMGLASRARSEVDSDLRSHGSDRFEQRIVRDVELLGLGSNACGKAGLVERPPVSSVSSNSANS